MKKFILLFLVILNTVTVLAQKQNITFSHLTTDDGLSQFSVNSLYVDEEGGIWIGTREGLNRYNGNNIKTFIIQKLKFDNDILDDIDNNSYYKKAKGF